MLRKYALAHCAYKLYATLTFSPWVYQTRAEAQKYYRSKVDELQGNLDQLQDTISKKQDNMSMVVQILQAKIRAQGNTPGPAKS